MMSNVDLQGRLIFFLLYSVIVVAFGLVLFFLFDSKYATAAIAVVCVGLLLTGLRIAVFGGTSDNKVRLRVASASTVLLFGALQLKSTALSLAKPFLEWMATKLNVPLPDGAFDTNSPIDYALASLIILAWVVICVFILRNVGTSPMGRPSNVALNEILTEPTTNKRIKSLKANLRNKLEIVNSQTQWSDTNYVPLEAEVQILEGKTARRKVVDLLRAIRVNPKTGLFIVLGEPGTGKSVALRTLASELLGHSRVKDRIPIYINLKEWKTDAVWTVDNKPTVHDFHSFVFQSLMREMDLPSQAFLKRHFDVLLEKGFFFFIFDSFDEIPAVLDHNEDSWIINELSNCISSYVLNSRGVIASRLFRQPKLSHRDRTVLEIQPFSDDRIVSAVKIACNEPDKLIRAIFNERVDLGTISRNPFLLHLIIFHFNEVSKPPESQAAMFQTFIDSNVDSAKRTLGVWDHSRDGIYQTCEDISAAMFENPYGGLEIAEFELRDQLDLPNLPFVLRFLVSARIGRIAPVSGAFSFSHRRFNEYFLVRRLSSKRTMIPFDSIQTDSRWRDALVLYAEIADEADANALIDHAWQYAKRLGTVSLGNDRPGFIIARNAFRFIIEGFRNRPAAVVPYRGELDAIISSKLDRYSSDYIETKTVLEGIALLDVQRATEMIVITMDHFHGWISEQAATAARYLPTIDPRLAERIYLHCVRRNGFKGIIEAKRQIGILSVTDAFKDVCSMLKWYVADVCKIWLFTVLFVISMIIGGDQRLLAPIAIGGVFATIVIVFVDTVIVFGGRLRRLDFKSTPLIVASFVLAVCIVRLRFGNVDFLSSALSSGHAIASVGVPLALLFLAILPITPRFWRLVKTATSTATSTALDGMLGAWRKQRSFATIWTGVRPLLLIVGGSIAAVLIGGYIASLIPASLIEWLKYVGLFAIFLFFFGLTAFSVFNGCRYIYSQWAERRALRRMVKSFRPERGEIARNFQSFKTGWARMAYVRELENLSIQYLDAFKRDDNTWPNGLRPQYRDEASMKLAQLDARWLDLD